MATTTRTITIPAELDPVSVLGPVDEVIREIERAYPEVDFTVRGNRIIIASRSARTESDASKAEHLIEMIVDAAHTLPMDAQTVRRMIEQDVLDNHTRATHPGHGKAIENLKRIEHTETRTNAERRKPSVAGVDPYLRPLYDALSDMLGADQLKRYMDDGTIEVAPLAYMRGRTLNDAFVILDEAQNTTEEQMKMFLTRLGFNTKMVITGDITQVDLAVPRSGLATIEHILGDIDDISFVHMTAEDVVRHRLVGRIVAAYNQYEGLDGDHRRMSRTAMNDRHKRDKNSDER